MVVPSIVRVIVRTACYEWCDHPQQQVLQKRMIRLCGIASRHFEDRSVGV